MNIDPEKLAARLSAISKTGASQSSDKNDELQARVDKELPGIKAGDIKIHYISPQWAAQLGYDDAGEDDTDTPSPDTKQDG